MLAKSVQIHVGFLKEGTLLQRQQECLCDASPWVGCSMCEAGCGEGLAGCMYQAASI